MGLGVGIVGLPNVGKSTLFNALLKKQLAYAANFPFATIEPNIGIVPVPDNRLDKLAEVQSTENKEHKMPPIVPATVEFVDIAGLIAGAHKGEGLGNKFLSHIRQTDAICHVVRAFENEDIIRHETAVGTDPKTDFQTIETELSLADLSTLENQKEPKSSATREEKDRWSAIVKIREVIENGKPARTAKLTDEELKQAKTLSLLTMKPILVALNVSENDLVNTENLEKKYSEELGVNLDQTILICAKVEEELSSLSNEDASEYLEGLGIKNSGLERLIAKAFKTLGLATFLTAGEKEVRAWTIPINCTAVKASGVIHTDFEKKFIKADVVSFDDFVEFGGWKNSREKGKVKSEGKDYLVRDGDVIEFKIGA